jgi:predicted HAD superfamily Cof-like phosphohydrolase
MDYHPFFNDHTDERELSPLEAPPDLFVSIKESELNRILDERQSMRENLTEMQRRSTADTEQRREDAEQRRKDAIQIDSLLAHLAKVTGESALLRAMSRLGLKPLSEQVAEFHAAMGVETPCEPVVPSAQVVRLRLRLIAEEFFELLRACGVDVPGVEALVMYLINDAALCVDMVEVADALSDLAYVIEGAFQAFGMRSAPLIAEVHASNLAKVGGGKDANGKIQKPEGWEPPNLKRVLLSLGMAA